MSFSDQPSPLTLWQKLSCLGVAVTGFLVTAFGLLIASLGHCAPEPDGSGCENVGIEKFLWFPGTAIFFVLAGVVMTWFFIRKNNSR